MQLLHLLLAARARHRDQWRSPEAIRALREPRLRRLARAAARTPHYAGLFRDLRLDPERLADPGQLARLPPLEKPVLHTGEENRLLAEPVDRLFPVTTSGSTGEPTRVYRSRRDQAEVSALWARVLQAYGHRFMDRQVNISTGRAVARQGPVALLRRLGLLPEIRHLSSFDPVDRQIEVLRELRPRTFSAYAISLELIAEALLERGISDVRPRVVFSAAMSLSERGRGLAEQAFGVVPYDVYVAAELGTLGWECPVERGTLHLNDDMQIVEILDDRDKPLPDGETGQVVVTQLCCLAQPLLRYRLGDLAARIPGQCTCGRGLARLTPVQGRTRHVIRTPDGRVLYGMMVSTVVKPFQEVRRWQLRQLSPDSLRLLVVPQPTWRPAVADALRKELDDRFGPGLSFEVVPVDDIPLMPTGKLQTIVPLSQSATPTSAPATGSARRSPP
jgi:phenylacetate-CoA ligase